MLSRFCDVASEGKADIAYASSYTGFMTTHPICGYDFIASK